MEGDDFVRGGIVRLLNCQDDVVCCGEVGSIADALLAVATQRPKLVLLDFKLEDEEGLELIHSLRRKFPEVAILVLSQHDERLYAAGALQAGARGYVMQEAATENLLNAIHRVLDGKIYLSRAMAARLLQDA